MGIALDLRGNSNSQPGIVSEVARSAKPGRIGRIDTPSRAHFHPNTGSIAMPNETSLPAIIESCSPRLFRVIYER
jgi:hypothetical protein